ncbi:hypothetical protein BCJMU02_2412 [Bacillus cereus]|nr:hypothetical protein BCJMU02_2412 [Bacillus cereus]
MLTELYDTFWFFIEYSTVHEISYRIRHIYLFYLYPLNNKIQKRFFSYEKESFSNFIHPITYGKELK